MENNVSTTFEQLGIRAKKSVAQHILLENAYSSNLVSDISNVDYLANNNGGTHLYPLAGLPTFVDDLYVFGYLEEKECIVSKGKVLCTTGETEGSAKLVVSRISSAILDLVDYKHIHTNISHTISANASPTASTIASTIARIEKETGSAARENWERQHPSSIYGMFVAKLDVSEIPIDLLHNILPTFEERLRAIGYGIYSIDYTRDFSGTLDRPALVRYLVDTHEFREQGTFAEAMGTDTPTILDNTDSVGKHVCTWISTYNGYTIRTKIYNKVVSNFEAGEVREHFGGHLADYVDCRNKHLQQTFLHPDVQDRGCTRIEVSMYASKDRTPETADYLLDNVLDLVSPQDCTLFVAQPPSRQWENLAKELDRCFVLADRPESTIYVCWYAHTRTKRIAGIRICPTQNTVDNDKLWNQAILWAMADFGFRNCPIFQTEILLAEKETGIHLSKLQCYTKDKDSKTILAACNRPCELHKNVESPTNLLPPTETIEFQWRQKKTHTIGIEKPAYTLQKVSILANKKCVSLLSTRARDIRLLELAEEQSVAEWKQNATNKLEEYQKEHTNTIEIRRRELEQLQEEIQRNERDQYNSRRIQQIVECSLLGQTQHISVLSTPFDTTNNVYSVLGYRQNEEYCRVVVAKQDDKDNCISIWANTGLRKMLQAAKQFVECKKDRYNRELCWFPKERIVYSEYRGDNLNKQKQMSLLF